MSLAEIPAAASPVSLDGDRLTLDELVGAARGNRPVTLAPAARRKIQASRAVVEAMIRDGRPVYGLTTGFGKLGEVAVSPAEAATLQRNLLLSHAGAVGEPLPEEVVRAVLLLRANALAKGLSGLRPEVVELLLALLNNGVHPVVPCQGSLGASGDLAPLAHLGLVLIGEGEAYWHGLRLPGREALARAGLVPLELTAKEGLALINGTQVMAGLLALAVHDAWQLLLAADLAAALAFEALGGIAAALDPRLQSARPHPGQGQVAARLRALLAGSGRLTAPGEARVQDAYSLRCTPQVHGASWDALRHVQGIVEIEMNAATDNPLVFAETGEAVSGGNFHGQPLALGADYLAIALAELADIAERRSERMVNPALSGLPAFLTPHPGLNSGLMIAQYTAASLVSENKVLAHPASVDSIPSSANQEDHVSMGTTAARKLWQVLANLRHVLAIELLVAAQAVDLGPADRPLGAGTAAAHRAIRQAVPFMEHDRYLHQDIEAVHSLLRTGSILEAVDAAVAWRT